MATDPTEKARSRTRSPAYPSWSLEEAIERSRLMYAEEDRHFISMEDVARLWSYNIKSSGLLQGISALKQFGLIVDEGSGEHRRVRPSHLASEIFLHDEGTPERDTAIREAALSPKIHRELWDKYQGKLPSSDSPIRYYLLKERGQDGESATFNKDYVDSFISQLRATIHFAGLDADDKMQGSLRSTPQEEATAEMKTTAMRPQEQEPPRSTPVPRAAASWMPATSKPGTTFRELPVTLPSLEIAVLKVPVPMSEEDYQSLVASINAMKKALIAREAARITEEVTVQKEP